MKNAMIITKSQLSQPTFGLLSVRGFNYEHDKKEHLSEITGNF